MAVAAPHTNYTPTDSPRGLLGVEGPTRVHIKRRSSGLVAALLLSGGCYTGTHGSDATFGSGLGTAAGDTNGAESGTADEEDPEDEGEVPPPENGEEVPEIGLRRLTAAEYDATLRDILLVEDGDSELLLPVDPRTPFDNDYTTQIPSETLIEATELLASDAADQLLEDPDRLAALLPCSPSGPDDEACLEAFAEQFGRRALRRPLTVEDVDVLLHGDGAEGGAAEFAVQEGDFALGVHTIVRALLQAPEFLYRVEIGEPVPGDDTLYKLNDWEMASRLSYLLWGSSPDDWVLDRAADGGISKPSDVQDVARQMLEDPRALERIERFHAMWLGYETLPFGGDLADAMNAETSALMRRVIFEEERPWQDLFRSEETFVNDLLAEHYGLPQPGTDEGAWVPYGEVDRQGLLSHGTFLSNGGKFGDTSPVQRGLMIRTRVFCETIPPPPAGVDPDEEPSEGICKEDRYAEHSSGGCAGCHLLIDPIGFGLENYGPLGAFREYEVDDPETPDDESTCRISGDGKLSGIGEFNGPAELSDLAVDAGFIDTCVQKQLYRFILGRYELSDADIDYLEVVADELGDDGFTFASMLMAFVGSDGFGYRREAPLQD